MIFKNRKAKAMVIEKTITICDSATQEIIEVIDIVDEKVETNSIKVLNLDDSASGGMIPALTDSEVEDMTMGKSLRDTYPDIEDRSKFVMDACVAAKTAMDAAMLTDEETEAAKLLEANKIKMLVDSDYSKELEKQKNKALEDSLTKEQEIENAERARHDAARKL